MMNLTTLPLSFWDYDLESAARILNMVPTKKVDKTPYELWYGKVPNMSYLKETMGYYFYFLPENKIVVARYAEFLEKNLLPQEVSGRAGELEEIQDKDTSPSKNTSEIPMEVEGFKPPHEEEVPIPYKARLVAKGYTQLYGVDYEEMFSPVADIRAIRILIAIAAFYDYEIWQMDVKFKWKVCKLQRSIYGLKQASRSWNKRFDEELKKFGFTQNLDEPCVYQKASRSNVTFLILYVDDIIIMGNHIPSLQSVKTYLGKCFAMKDLGEAAFILGIKIYRDRSKRLIGLSQSAYIDKILKRFKMDTSKRGSIMYAVRCTKPDVAFAQNITSQFQQNLGKPHWTAVKTILKYLRNNKDMFLVYGAVDWKSSKQSTTAMSVTEVEYIAASEAAMEAVWIRKFISGLVDALCLLHVPQSLLYLKETDVMMSNWVITPSPLNMMPTATRTGMTLVTIEEMIERHDNGDGNESGNGGGGGNGNVNGLGGGNRNGNPNVNAGGIVTVARKCTYQDFVKCQPLNFKGTGGVVGPSRWIEKMETVFHISNCPQKYKVKYSTCTLQKGALTFWNSHKRTVRTDASYTMMRKALIKLMTEVYCLRNEIQQNGGWVVKPNPYETPGCCPYCQQLDGPKVEGYAARNVENKRIFDNNSRDNHVQQPPF
ncbi:retrotransposon protein, putative, ty1-copia subclass [Tanacetum coccineum]